MVWKNTRQVLQTAAAPPSRGSTILATIGSTRNIRPALRKRVLANIGNIIVGHRRGTIRERERALVIIYYALFHAVVWRDHGSYRVPALARVAFEGDLLIT